MIRKKLMALEWCEAFFLLLSNRITLAHQTHFTTKKNIYGFPSTQKI